MGPDTEEVGGQRMQEGRLEGPWERTWDTLIVALRPQTRVPLSSSKL